MKAEQRQLVCQAEIEGWRPDWKEWVLLESKRRLLLHFPPNPKASFVDKGIGQ